MRPKKKQLPKYWNVYVLIVHNKSMDTLATMRAFAAVARQQSFTAGAKELGLTTKVVSNQVRALEERLGVQLLFRTTRRVSLTDTGAAYFKRCLSLLDQFDEVESLVQARQSELAGLIRMTAPTAFGSAELARAIAPFQAQHPQVEIDLQLADHRVNIVEDGFDLALRFGQLDDSTLIARKLLDMRVVVYASPDYLAKYGEPDHPRALVTHNCLRLQTSSDAASWPFRDASGEFNVRVKGSVRANSPRAVAHLAAAGCGIGMTPLYVAEPLLQRGELKLLFEIYEARVFPLHAVYPGTRHLVARVRALIDHLVQALSG